MVVVKPPDQPVDVQGDTAGGARANSATAWWTPENYVFTAADTAERLFLATNESRMVVLETVPPSPQFLLEAPAGLESTYLTFSAPEVADKERYTALFLGPGVGFGSLFAAPAPTPHQHEPARDHHVFDRGTPDALSFQRGVPNPPGFNKLTPHLHFRSNWSMIDFKAHYVKAVPDPSR